MKHKQYHKDLGKKKKKKNHYCQYANMPKSLRQNNFQNTTDHIQFTKLETYNYITLINN